MIALLLLTSKSTFAQYKGALYQNYTTAHGLAANVCHGIVNDHDGFIWIGTESGLSRFDGRSFKNFTMADGLPSNEVLGLFVDSKNRIWIASFKNAVCYYQNGKIYNQNNHPGLRKISLKATINGFAETSEGAIVISESKTHTIIHDNWKIVQFPDLSPLGNSYRQKSTIIDYSGTPPPAFLPAAIQKIISSNPFISVRSYCRNNYLIGESRETKLVNEKGEPGHQFFYDVLTARRLSDTVVAFTFLDKGAKLVDISSNKTLSSHLPDYKVHDVLLDDEDILWFTTNGNGIFQLNNNKVTNYVIGDPSDKIANIYSLHEDIYVLSNTGKLHVIKNPTTSVKPGCSKEIFHPSKMPRNTLIRFSHATLPQILQRKTSIKDVVKSVFLYRDTLLVTTSGGAYRFSNSYKVIDSLFNKRATCAINAANTIYIGSLDGLYQYRGDSVIYLGENHPLLKSRIVAMAEDLDHIIWIATYENGIIGYKNGKIAAHIHKDNSSLASNICNCIYIDDDDLWVGTFKGLYKIDLRNSGYSAIKKYDVSDGLYSNTVQSVFVKDKKVYAGTGNVVCSFEEEELTPRSSCNLVLTAIINSGKNYIDQLNADKQARFIFPSDRKNIRFEYTGLSFRSFDDMQFKYRLQGIDSSWHTTTEQSVSYPFLPFGKYIFEIKAINKYGIESAVKIVPFEISPGLWENPVLKFAVVLLLVFGIVFLLKWRIHVSTKAEKQKIETERKIMVLEQAALKAQMSPHFIFNCLNSIQGFILERDVKGANFYLAKFAKLIRQTLDYSGQSLTTLSQEVDYLTNYLNLESLQTGPSFSFHIDTTGVTTMEMMIPVMMIQPFVENAIKHGVGPLKEGGEINLTFRNVPSGDLYVDIMDNGCGILHKKNRDKERHTSKGISLIKNRIAIWNQLNARKIILETGWASKGHGTRITLIFPIISEKDTRC